MRRMEIAFTLVALVSLYAQVEGGPVTLYYFAVSPNARTADLLAHAIDLPVKLQVIDISRGQQFTPEFLKINPLHTIPTIDDNGFILWDSHAIMAYLVSKYGKDDSLYPKDLQKRAIVDQYMHYSNDVYYAARLSMEALAANNTEALDFMKTYVTKHQQNIEKLLQGKRFFTGESLTIADYSFINIVSMLQILAPPEGMYPLTEKWMERCKSSMKEFDKVNKEGSEIFIKYLQMKLSSAKSSSHTR